MKLAYSKDKKVEIEHGLNIWKVRKKDKELNEYIKFVIIQRGETKFALVISYNTHKICDSGLRKEIDKMFDIFNSYHNDIYFESLEEAMRYSGKLTQDYFK